MATGIKITELPVATSVAAADSFALVQGGVTKEAAIEAILDFVLPAGFAQPFMGSTAPTGWIAYDGSAVSRTAYPKTFAAIGTTWGAGDGSTTFNLPDLQGAFLRGTGSHGAETMADGNPFAGPAVGAFEDDQMQGHWHDIWGANGAAQDSSIYNQARTTSSGYALLGSNNAVRGARSDGINGTPRTGDETRPFAAGVLWCGRAI